MSQLPIWAQLIQFGATISLAVFVAYIAYRQWQTAHDRVVLDLFERRMAVYDAARVIIGSIVRDGSADKESYFRYLQATDRLHLLFGDEVVAYSDETRERINQLSLLNKMVKASFDSQDIEDHNKYVQEAAERLKEIYNFYEEFPKLVTPYVRMTHKLR